MLQMLGPEVEARRQDHQGPEEAVLFVKERPQPVELEQDQRCQELVEQVLEACGDFTPTILQELKCKLTKSVEKRNFREINLEQVKFMFTEFLSIMCERSDGIFREIDKYIE